MRLLVEFRNILSEFGLEYFRKYYAVYKGIVVSNEDPEFRGRLKLRVPSVWGNGLHEYWAPSRGMPSGNKTGLWLMPLPGDVVWVTFEQGDPRLPVWEYGPWSKAKVPADAKSGDKDQSKIVVLQASEGWRIVIDQKKNKIFITSPDGETQPAVLGNDLVDLLKEFFDDIGTLKWVSVTPVPTLGLVTGELSSSPLFPILKVKWNLKWKTMLSDDVEIS